MAAILVSIFWNRDQRRLRAAWRLLIQGLTWLGVQIVLQVPVGIAFGLALLGSGQATPEQLMDPAFVMDRFTNSPLLAGVLQITMFVTVLATVWLAGRFLDRRRFADFGFRFNRAWRLDFGFGLLLGALLMGLIFGVELAAGWVRVSGTFVAPAGVPFAAAIFAPLGMFILVGIHEEMWFRGYHLTNLAEGLNGIGPRGAILIAALLSSMVFGLLHASNPNATVASTLNIMLAGLFLALGYILTGELAISIGLHISWNFFQGNVFDFPVSGAGANVVTLIGVEQGGPARWTGGAFGPEAGLLGIIAMLTGSALILLWVRWQRGSLALHEAIAAAPEKPGPLFRRRAADKNLMPEKAREV
jgi:hypothetical protein